MRDILLIALLFGALPIALFRPYLAIALYIWISVMNPHRLTWGAAFDMPWAQLYAVAALLSIAFAHPRQVWPAIKDYWLVLLLLAWMSFTTLFAAQPEFANPKLLEVTKIHLMCIATLAVLTSRKRTTLVLAILVASVAFYGVKGGIYTLQTGGGGRVWGPTRSMIGDNNELATALVTMLPLVYWAFVSQKQRVVKYGIGVSMILVLFSILGSQSRGAFLAIGVVGLSLVIKGRRNFIAVLILLASVFTAMSFMPDTYWNRINTIATYNEDTSATGRINTWITAYRVANDRLTGGGFIYYGSDLFFKHAPDKDEEQASHSIYFQALGEHGWPGLFLYLMILANFWRMAGRLASQADMTTDAGRSDRLLGKMFQVSLLGFMTAGAFVNVGHWDAFFFLYVVLIALHRHPSSKAVQSNAKPVDTAVQVPIEKLYGVRLPNRTTNHL